MAQSIDLLTFGEAIVDMTSAGTSDSGQRLYELNAGGSASIVAAAAAAMGANTALIGKVGADRFGHFLEETMAAVMVNTSGLIFDPEASTTMSFVDLDDKGRPSYSFLRKPGADSRLKITELPHNLIEEAKLLHVSGLALSDEPIRGAVAVALQQAREAGKIICLDPNYRADIWQSEAEFKARTLNAVNSADLVIMNVREMRLLTDTNDVVAAAAKMHGRGVKIVIILSSEDTYINTLEGEVNVRTFPTAAVDTTGAGGIFIGTFLAKFISLPNPLSASVVTLKDAALLANAASALSTKKRGGIPSIPPFQDTGALLLGDKTNLNN